MNDKAKNREDGKTDPENHAIDQPKQVAKKTSDQPNQGRVLGDSLPKGSLTIFLKSKANFQNA